MLRLTIVDAAVVLAIWFGLLVAETTALGFLWGDFFSAGSWEIALVRQVVVPMAVVALAPVSLLVAAGWRLATSAERGSPAAALVLFAGGAVASAAVALGVSQGRHFANWGIRGAFVCVLAVAGGWVAGKGMPSLVRLARYPAALAFLGAALAVGFWLADDYVLPRLYEAMHLAFFAGTLCAAALVAFSVPAAARTSPVVGGAVVLGAGILLFSCARSLKSAADVLDRATNLRFVLVEHAPLLGRAVALETFLRPPESDPKEASMPIISRAFRGEVARTLDWTGHDVLLLTVDALRADHASAYGYPRVTSPNLDALAREGTLFERAYCPTPHTSYSITSMMTGKYMRPLLALGLGDDSETWASYVREYGWRTAAFYPPAVFFIDEGRFTRLEKEHLGFEYSKVEFADPALREQQVREYLDVAAAPGLPLLLWVHFFEPHEPYVAHADHVFTGGPSHDVDAYDGEVAAADDGIGRVVRLVRSRRPGAVVVVTADHGEEFGEHGGRYHGTTVYEEQVRVPLIVAGAGVKRGARVATVVQTIDILPTALSALGIPRPARLRGRDLGQLLAGDGGPNAATDHGFAFSETDDYALVAAGGDRLICQRRAGACALYSPQDDPLERRDRSAIDPARVGALRAELRSTERDHGRYEAAGGPAWPEALRRGLQGEADAMPDVAALLDDAAVTIRRKAAEVSFALHSPVAMNEVRRAFLVDEDEEVRRWTALTLVRMGADTSEMRVAEALLHDGVVEWRRRAALALAERGDGHTCDELGAWWNDVAPKGEGLEPQLALDLPHAEELLTATAKARCHAAVEPLIRALDDVRARPYVADALASIHDDRANARLRALLADEAYVTTRGHEARALLALGSRDWSSNDEPVDAGGPAGAAEVRLSISAEPSRLVALVSDDRAGVEVVADGRAASPVVAEGEVRTFDLPLSGGRGSPRVGLVVHALRGGVAALWVVPRPGDLIDRPRSRK